MEATARSFTFLNSEKSVKIPFFQRGYIWNKDNWEELLNDLINTKKNNYFMGSIILKNQERNTGEPTEALVIDGQQRLTTLSILVKALYDSFPPELRKDCKDFVRHPLFYKINPTDNKYLIKIKHSQIDSKAFQKVIETNFDTDEFFENPLAVDDSDSKIIKCYQYLNEKLQDINDDDRIALFNKILDNDNKMLVVIDLKADDDEQAIFDTINSAGVRLSSADIIKNALFNNQSESTVELYNGTWHKAFLVDEYTIKYWENERLTGRFKRDNLEILLHCIAVIKGFYDPDKHTLSELSNLYKKQIKTLTNAEELKAFVEEIKEYADIYRLNFPNFDKSDSLSFDADTMRILHILEILQISTFHPFMLFILKKYKEQTDIISQLFSNLEKLVVRRVTAKQETKSFNKFCKDFITDTDTILHKIKETTNEQVSGGLRGISNKNAALLLFWIELNRRNNDPKTDRKDLKYNYSLEHIMPQEWKTHWNENMPEKNKPDGTLMDTKEAQEDRDEKIYWLGNMTLLTSSLNSALSNNSFEKKINGDGRKKGIKLYAELFITKADIVSKFEDGDTEWNEMKIEERTKKLEGEFNRIWGMPVL